MYSQVNYYVHSGPAIFTDCKTTIVHIYMHCVCIYIYIYARARARVCMHYMYTCIYSICTLPQQMKTSVSICNYFYNIHKL